MNSLHKVFWSKLKSTKRGGCCLFTGKTFGEGYGCVCYGGKVNYAHRLSWELRRGPIPKGMQILHKCDIRLCVNLKHLFIGTQKDNMHDMIKKGRARHGFRENPRRGSKHPNAKLTPELVAIFRDKRKTMMVKDIADEYGFNPSTVGQAINGHSWGWLKTTGEVMTHFDEETGQGQLI